MKSQRDPDSASPRPPDPPGFAAPTDPRWPPDAHYYSRRARIATRCLDILPWPLGQECLAWTGSAIALLDSVRRRRALQWAARHRSTAVGRLSLAVKLFANHARFVAIGALVGVGRPEVLRPHIVVRGVEHLDAAVGRGATILLGFHLGPPGSFLALRVLGYRLTFVGLLDVSGRWERGAWRPLLAPAKNIALTRDPASGSEALQRARRVLDEGGTIVMTADGPFGAESFRVPVTGGEVVIRPGWLALRRLSGAVTLPLLAHWRGRRRVIEVSPPLPTPVADPIRDTEACREFLTPILSAFVQQHPAQCPVLAFWPDGRPVPRVPTRSSP
jgi:lauroyl/myristoyl acyltransferase